MAAITWRNVTGASAGSPSSSMAAAISGFGQAGRGALDQIDSLRIGQDRANDELTQQAIASVMASGRPLDASTLSNFAPGVNTQDVLSSVLGARKDQSSIARDTAGIAYDRERTAELAYQNSPENREFARRQQEAETKNIEEQLNLRRLELRRLQANDKREADRLDGITAVQRGYNAESPDGLRGRAMQRVNDNWETVVREYASSEQFKDLSPAERLDAISAWEVDAREQFIQDEMGRMAPQWFAEQQSKYGLTETDLGETTYGRQYQDIQAANTKAITDSVQTELRERRNKAKKAKTDAENRDYASVIPTGQGYKYNSNAADQKENRLSENKVDNYLKEEMDIELDPDELKHAREVLRTVGGNKAKFHSIMEDTVTNRRWWRLGPLDDEIDWNTAKVRGELAQGIMQGILDTESTLDPADTPGGGRMTFQDRLNSSLKKKKK